MMMMWPAARQHRLRQSFGCIRGLRILIGGGDSGFLSGSVGAALQGANHQVIHVSRTPRAGTPHISWQQLASDGIPADIDAVVNLTGCNVLNALRRWGDEFECECIQSRQEPVELIAEAIGRAAPSAAPKVWIQISGVGYHQAYDDASKRRALAIDDETSAPGTGYWSNFQQQIETHARELLEASSANKKSKMRLVMLRSGVVLGKNAGALAQMLPLYRLGLGGPIGSGKQPFPWIHLQDVVGIIQHIIENKHAAINDDAVLAVAPNLATNAEFAQALASALHRPAFLRTPAFAIKMLYGSTRAELLLEGPLVRPKRALDTGYQFKFPTLESAFKDICS